MAVLFSHIGRYREVFQIKDLLAEPFLMVGYQDIFAEESKKLPPDFDFKDLPEALRSRGIKDIATLDVFDSRATLSFDLNVPVPAAYTEKYQTVFDIGTLEHVFDTKQCLENCMSMVALGGHYFLHTPVKGYFRHGFHTFNPELIIQSFVLNHFEIVHLTYSSPEGIPLDDPRKSPDVILWIVGKKKESLVQFHVPQQQYWKGMYEQGESGRARGSRSKLDRIKSTWLIPIIPPILVSLYRFFKKS